MGDDRVVSTKDNWVDGWGADIFVLVPSGRCDRCGADAVQVLDCNTARGEYSGACVCWPCIQDLFRVPAERRRDKP